MILKNCNIIEFVEYAKNRRIFGFGANEKRYEDHFIFRTPEHDIRDYLYKIVDNDTSKHGKQIIYYNGSIDVVSVGYLIKEINPFTDAILIVSSWYGEIIEQLDKYNELEEVECFILDYIDTVFDSRIDYVKFRNSQSNRELIPPVIHYFWVGDRPMPTAYLEYIESWKRYCPGYEIVKWDETNYDVKKNAYLRCAYENKMWAFVSDYARLDIIYTYGGIYFDTDVELMDNIDHLRHFDSFFGFESTEIVATGLGFGAKKGHPLLKEFMADYETIGEKGVIQPLPCTIMQTNILRGKGLIANNTFQMLENDTVAILPTEFLCGKRLATNFMQITENTCSIHHYLGDWGGVRSENTQVKRSKDSELLKRIQTECGRGNLV